jgi:hypothetical protein
MRKYEPTIFLLLIIAAMLAFFGWGLAHSDGATMQSPKDDFTNSGVSERIAAELGGYFSDAAKRLKRIVLKPPGGNENSQAYRAAIAAQQIQQIDRIALGLKIKASGWVGRNIPAAMSAGVKLAHEQAIEAKVKTKDELPEGSFSLIDVGTVRKFAADTLADLHRAADSMADRGKSVLRQTQQQGLSEKEINKILAGGVIEGRPRDTYRALEKELKALHGETVEVNGINFDTRYYAELVARTKTRQATVAARHERLEDLGLDLVMIIGRQSGNFCSAFLGQVFSLSGKDQLPGVRVAA